MDFFETQERYRRREMRGWTTLLVRATVIGGCLWLGWLWGHAEQTSLQAEAEAKAAEAGLEITDITIVPKKRRTIDFLTFLRYL